MLIYSFSIGKWVAICQVDGITSMEQDQQIAALVVAQKTHGVAQI
jgi:hypothetical protein